MADGFDAILIRKREGPFAVMSPQMTRASDLTLLKYTQLSKFYRFRVADGEGLVGSCMLGPVHNVNLRDVATMRSGEFLRLKEAQECAIRSLCFVKVSDDLVAELVNMDEKLARDVLTILPRLNQYIGLMHAELIDVHKLGSPVLSAGSFSARSVSSDSSARDGSLFVEACAFISALAAPTPLKIEGR
jgi:hypothetical protein